MATPDPAYRDHQAWLGYLQPDGLVVSPAALVDSQIIIDRSQATALQQRLADFTEDSESEAGETQIAIPDIHGFLTRFLEWPEDCLHGEGTGRALPDDLRIPLPELEQDLTPSYALSDPKAGEGDSPWLLLVKVLDTGTPLDQRQSENARTWNASEHQRFERLLRETKVTIGLLTNHREIRLVYAPRGESAGSITFPAAAMGEVSGRLIIGAFHQLLKGYTLLTAPSDARLSAVLKRSRDYQANVSIKLAEQVVEALYELLRGFQSADGQTKGELLRDVMAREPDAIYRGLLNSLLRIVFLLYAEDRGLMPTSGLYVRNYSVHGLFERLRADAERYPDTMDHRYGAWSQLLAVFRVVFQGSKNPHFAMPPRQGHLFDPAPFPFLEGRNLAEPSVPLVPDGAIFRILSNLLLLDGERLSYKTLDVEQIGSVYETIMGFCVEQATGRMIALKPKKRHGAPLHIDLDALLATKPADREKSLVELADTKLPDSATKALKAATSVDDLLVAVEKRIDKRATPSLAPAGSIILQPTDERRRSGSHYTPRSFTEPIVRKTLEPILERLGKNPLPEAILDLKIADIAVGSAAFLVETCRQLADELVASWRFHRCIPTIPSDEDELLYARRIVAQRCLYGVDRNPMAVDLAKLSLWLATMAKDHPFTFLDHAIKCGDSLVGLTNRQIADFHWFDRDRLKRELEAAVKAHDQKEIKRIKANIAILQTQAFGQQEMEKLIERVVAKRREIITDPEDTEYAILRKQARLAEAEAAAQKIKTTGDLAIAAFFAESKPKERQQLRDEFLQRHLAIQQGQNVQENLPRETHILHELRYGEHPIRPFHWEIEFPEVFSREDPGFDGIVGNPPFAGVVTLAKSNHSNYTDFLRTTNSGTGGKCDLVAFFFRRAWILIRKTGSFGLISTKTIAQGDTRRSSLTQILAEGACIYFAQRRREWPGEAAVVISVVILSKLHLHDRILDGKAAANINAFLLDSEIVNEPNSLQSNSNRAFLGCKPGNKWHIIGDATKGNTPENLVLKALSLAPEEQAGVTQYIGGADLYETSDCSPRRQIIKLGLLESPEASKYPHLLEVLARNVTTAARNKTNWWQFSRRAVDLFERLPAYDRVLVRAEVSDTFAFVFCPSSWVFSNKAIVFLYTSENAFGILQSTLHEFWARLTSSTQGDGLSYVPAYSLDTFPFPENWETNSELSKAAASYYEYRSELMMRLNKGLTETYNRFHDPSYKDDETIKQLHALHAAMDRAVLDAYGWSDIVTGEWRKGAAGSAKAMHPLEFEFILDYEDDDVDQTETTGKKRQKKKPWRYRWPDDVRDEVLARLLALNAERAAQEKLVVTATKVAAKKVAKKKPAAKPADDAQIELFPVHPSVTPSAPGDPLRERIAAFRFDLPDSPRPADANSMGYYRIFIPALIQEAGGRVPWNVVHNAAALLSDKELLQSFLSESPAKTVKAWSRKSKLLTDPDAFAAAIEESILTAKKVRITGTAPSFELRLAPEVSINRAPWHLLDARFALTAALAAIEQGTNVEISEDLNAKIIEFARTA